MADVAMPRLSDSMEEGTILKWLKSDGDEVKRGDELVEIETDKANMTYEADQDGVLSIVASEGDTLPVGETIATIGEGSADGGGESDEGGESEAEAEEQDDSADEGEEEESAPEAEEGDDRRTRATRSPKPRTRAKRSPRPRTRATRSPRARRSRRPRPRRSPRRRPRTRPSDEEPAEAATTRGPTGGSRRRRSRGGWPARWGSSWRAWRARARAAGS